MSTVLKKLGPTDHGRPMTLEEFMAARSVEGYHYELIDGKLYVSPLPNLPENRVEDWVFDQLKLYVRDQSDVINFVTNKARVFVPRRRRLTNPEPDVAAYRNFPLHLPFRSVRWQDVSPILVVEVLSLDDPDKDLVRNVELYLQVPSIKEYWLFDTRRSRTAALADAPALSRPVARDGVRSRRHLHHQTAPRLHARPGPPELTAEARHHAVTGRD